MHWLYLVFASCFEVCWFYCIKYLNNLSVNELLSGQFLANDNGWLVVLSLLGYAGFGVGNVVFFSMALKKIPASTAFGIWTGLALAGTTLVDAYVLSVDFVPLHVLFILLIFGGVIGLKFSARSKG